MIISKSSLVNLATPDSYIAPLKSTNPQLHQAVKNLGNATQQLINGSFPPQPAPEYQDRVILIGIWTTSTDVLSQRYRVVLPADPSGYWTYSQINLSGAAITCKVNAASSPFSADILVSQLQGTTTYKTLFQPGFNPILPVGVPFTSNVMFAINTLYPNDLIRVDILNGDGVCSDVEIVLVGTYQLVENIK
jgi:hypothetical protein